MVSLVEDFRVRRQIQIENCLNRLAVFAVNCVGFYIAEIKLGDGCKWIFKNQMTDQIMGVKPDLHSLDLGMRLSGDESQSMQSCSGKVELVTVIRYLRDKIIGKISFTGEKGIGDIIVELFRRSDEQLMVFLGVNGQVFSVIKNDLWVRCGVVPTHYAVLSVASGTEKYGCSSAFSCPHLCSGHLGEIKLKAVEASVDLLQFSEILSRSMGCRTPGTDRQ